MIWCEILFKNANTVKLYPDVRRMYTKGGFFCIELPNRDDEGMPIIRRFPIQNIFWVDSPHVDHVGAEPR